jgi:hypothetical protein
VHGQQDQDTQTITLAPGLCSSANWVGNVATSQGSINWLSISPTRGDLSPGSRSIAVSLPGVSALPVGVYAGLITFTDQQHPAASSQVSVILDVVPDQHTSSLGSLVAYTRIADLAIIVTSPYLVKDQSANITISLLSSRNLPKSAAPVPGAKGPMTQSLASQEMGKSDRVDWLLENAYGSHLTSLSAQLSSTAFDISSLDPPAQDPDQHQADFRWNILPKKAGSQSLEVAIAGQWISTDGTPPKTVYIIYSGFSLSVDDVPAPFITTSQIDLSAFVVTLIGSVLNLPWILEYIQKRRKERKHSSGNTKKTSTVASGSTKSRVKRRKKGP